MASHEPTTIKIAMDTSAAIASQGHVQGKGGIPTGGFGPTGLGTMGMAAIDAGMKQLNTKVGQIKDASNPRNFLPKIGKFFQKLGRSTFKGLFGGISVGALIRQSQIFTATAGSFFQIAGAMIDTILAPLAPRLAKVINEAASKGIAMARKVGKGLDFALTFLDKIPKLFEWFARGIPKFMTIIFNTIDWFKNLADVLNKDGIIGLGKHLLNEYWKYAKYMFGLFTSKVVDPIWNWVKKTWKTIKEKSGFDFPGFNIMGWELKARRIPFFGASANPMAKTSASKQQEHLQKANKILEGSHAMSVENLQVSPDFANLKLGDKKLPHGFMELPETAKDVMDNLKMGSELVKDIYSGFHMDGETPGQLSIEVAGNAASKIFDEKVGAVGLKSAIQKVIKIVSKPTTLLANLENLLEGPELGAVVKNIIGGGGTAGTAGYYDDITNKKMGDKALAEISSSTLSGSDLRNFKEK